MQRLMVESPFLLIRAALPGMYERGWGRVVNISSAHGLRASPFKSAYVAAKHGLEGLVEGDRARGRAARRHEQLHQPRRTCARPSSRSRSPTRRSVHGIPESEVVEKIMLTETAIKRLVEPDEVASLAGWLVSDKAGMVTGASYTMDGGWTAR